MDVIVGSDLKWKEHVDIMVGKANKTFGMLKQTFESSESGLWKDLYVSLVRPRLEYGRKRGIRICKETFTKSRGLKEALPEFQLVFRNLNMRTDQRE